jgi:hypothetical protein
MVLLISLKGRFSGKGATWLPGGAGPIMHFCGKETCRSSTFCVTFRCCLRPKWLESFRRVLTMTRSTRLRSPGQRAIRIDNASPHHVHLVSPERRLSREHYKTQTQHEQGTHAQTPFEEIKAIRLPTLWFDSPPHKEVALFNLICQWIIPSLHATTITLIGFHSSSFPYIPGFRR